VSFPQYLAATSSAFLAAASTEGGREGAREGEKEGKTGERKQEERATRKTSEGK